MKELKFEIIMINKIRLNIYRDYTIKVCGEFSVPVLKDETQ